MLGIISKIFGGNKSEKDVNKILPLVGEIQTFFKEYASLSNDELRAKTSEFRTRIKNHLVEIDASIEDRNKEAEALPSDDIEGRDAIYKDVDELKKERDRKIEEILKELLPEAFAVVKETSRRFKENAVIESTATELDRELATKREHVKIDGNKSFFQNSWKAAGNTVNWNMVHYDVQLIGGAVLHSGKISEMATGEGKTLVSTLPAYLNA